MKTPNEKEIRIGLGRKVKAYREACGMSQEDLAEKLETSSTSISSIERGITYPMPQKVAKLLNVFNISMRDLFDFGVKNKSAKAEKHITALIDKMRYEFTDEQIEILYNNAMQYKTPKV